VNKRYILLARNPLTSHVDYFVTTEPRVLFSRKRERAKVMDEITVTAWSVYLARLGYQVFPVFAGQVSDELSRPINPVHVSVSGAVKSQKDGVSLMINRIKKYFVVLAAFVLTLGLVLPADAQAIVSSTSTVQLSYVVGESITVTGAPPSLTFSGSPNPVTGPLSVTTSWVLAASRTHLDTNLFFASATAALTDGSGHNIAASTVQANLNGGAFSPCNTNPAADVAGVAVAGATCNVGFGVAITGANLTSSHTDTFILQLLASGLSGLPAGTYTGQLNIVAGAN
jgi:hypothetical protein